MTCTELALSMDVVPTVLDWCGLEPPTECDGRSLRGVLSDGEPTPHDRVFWDFNDQAAVRDGDWKLTLDAREVPPGAQTADLRPVDDSVFLTNLAEDPGETDNHAEDRPDIVTDLQTALQEWQSETAE